MKILRRLAWLATAAAYVQIVLGAVVRISGSGLGCGPNWPLCNGHLIPPLDDIGTLIEYCHRLSALVLGASLLVLVSASWWRRRESPAEARLWRTAALAGALYIGIALLGAVTVLLDLSAWAVIPHLAAALGLLATLVVAILRTKPESSEPTPLRARRSAIAALVLGAAVLLLGGLTANLGAAGACIGFPLCSGSVWPAGRLAVLQWTHRLMAYGLFLHLVGLVAANRRRQAPAGLQRATQAALLLALAQIAVAAVMVLAHLPPLWRGLHAAVGVGVWLSLIVLTGRAMDTPAAA